MTIEAYNNTLRKRLTPLYNNFWKETIFNLNIRGPIVLNHNEANLVINEFKYIKGTYVHNLRIKLLSKWFKIILNPNKYKSNYDGSTKTITIWIKNHKNTDAESYFRWANLNTNVDERFILWTMFIHECSHHILNECFESMEIQELSNFIANCIRISGKTLTKLSRTYNGWDKIKEDITEMIRMYIDNPKILQNHLHFLSTTWDIRILNEYNLYRITQQDEKKIYFLIKKLVNNYLQLY